MNFWISNTGSLLLSMPGLVQTSSVSFSLMQKMLELNTTLLSATAVKLHTDHCVHLLAMLQQHRDGSWPTISCLLYTLQVFKKWSPDRAQFKMQPKWRQRMQKQAVGLF